MNFVNVDVLAEDALNLCVKHIQTTLGVETGDLASRAFSDNKVLEALIAYINQELSEAELNEANC